MAQPALTCLKLTTETPEACKICSKLTIKRPERRQGRRSGVLIVDFERISHLVLISVVNLEHANAGWGK